MFFRKPVDINKSFIFNYASIFSCLKRSEKNLIAQKSKILNYKKGDVIYKQGEPPDAFYCVISGRVKIFKIKDSKETVLEFLTSGMYFGIISLLTTRTHSVNAVAVNESLILKIKNDDFDLILRKIPRLAIDLSKTLSEQIRRRDYARGSLKSNIISIYGAVRGIGRTMYAVNLAISLRKETEKKVVFVEIGKTGRDLFKVLNIDSKSDPINLQDLPLGRDEINKFIIKSSELNIDFFNITHNPKTDNSYIDISSFLSLLTNEYQYVIVDLPVDRSRLVFKSLAQSDSIHLITDHDLGNLKSTRELMVGLFREVEYPQEKIKVILNEKKNMKKIPYDEVVKILDHGIFANIPVFWQAADKINAESVKIVLTQPDSEYARAIRRIAREIGNVLVGLALGSGAAFGLAHIGVIKALEKENIPIDVVAGTSIGALIGALWSTGKSGKDIEKIMMGFNKNKIKVFRLLFDFCLSKSSLAKGNRVAKFLKKHLGNKTFCDIKFPLKIIACNLDKRERVVFSSGKLIDAVRASLAIPGIFEPLKLDSDLIIDGGILEPIPVRSLEEAGIKKIIAVNVLPSPEDIQEGYKNFKLYLEREKQDVQRRNFVVRAIYYLRILFRKIFFPNIFDIMVNSILAMEYAVAKQDCLRADVVINPIIIGTNWFEFFRTDELIRKGQVETINKITSIREVVNK